MLVKDWKKQLRYAFSIRFHLVSCLFTTLELLLPYLNEWYNIPRGLFIGLALVSQIGGIFFKFYSQKVFRDGK